mmetsp:Transcript_24274/g.28272  ORF Transcript_24274/g.28272 Transcript_24274/m.28272 type:complete len:419 (+) Transcript_24274:85-1341(+)
MMKNSSRDLRAYRPNYNLATATPGRMMTGFMTPYRHWMWKQNELWRNVHEAQFEHLRKVYRRQWLESFRVNADEYIYKYNITKAAQLAQWEHEMHQQEAKRRETLQTAQGRQALKAKHLDLLREYHERHFFFWYERASERLQYMAKIKYVTPEMIDSHIEKELNKYVAGKSQGYPLNFVGQLPMLEDSDGNVVEVPAELMTSHSAERPNDTSAKVYEPPATGGDEQLRKIVSGLEEESLDISDSTALASAIEDIARREDALSDEAKVAKSMEETDDDREIAKRKYINRGQTGSKSVFRKPKADGSAPPPPASTKKLQRKLGRKLDDQHKKSQDTDVQLAAKLKGAVGEGGAVDVKIGEIKSVSRRNLRDKVHIPTVEELMQNPMMAAAASGKQVRMKDLEDERFNRGKFKKGNDDEGM